jgi:hypothetical protein
MKTKLLFLIPALLWIATYFVWMYGVLFVMGGCATCFWWATTNILISGATMFSFAWAIKKNI